MVLLPQKSLVVPQKPYSEQHTLRGHLFAADHLMESALSITLTWDRVAITFMPQPGLQSDLLSQLDMQLSPQKSGPIPQTPVFEQQPSSHGLSALQV
jgi:hypothetical protein